MLAGLVSGPAAETLDRLTPYGIFIIYGLMLTGVLWMVINPIASAFLRILL